MKPLPVPEILIFDVDGVLVDVRGTFWRSTLDTVRALTGRRVNYRELHRWKSLPGYNDDWKLTSEWATKLGRPTTYEQARKTFVRFYWGTDGKPGHVRNEKFIVPVRQIARWARRYELDIFTGRTRKEFNYTFAGWAARPHFRTVVTMDDVRHKKPHPEGLLRILGKRDPARALYVGDNVDDALAARAAEVAFAAVLPKGMPGYRERAAKFRELGAIILLPGAAELHRWLSESG